MPIEQLGHRSHETERTPDQIQKDIDEQIRNGVPERASVFQAELLGLRLPDAQNPIPEGVELYSINALGLDDNDPRASLTPRHIRFLRDTAAKQAGGELGLGYPASSEANVGPVRARLAVELTGHYRLGSSGDFTAIGAGDTLFGKGDPEQVREYLNSLGYKELAPGYDQPEGDKYLEAIMPDIALAHHNYPTAD